MKTLIIYSSRDGQTKKIAEFIARKIHAEVVSLEQSAGKNLNDFERIVIGASVRYGHFHKALYEFIEKQTALLNQKTTAFFGVNLTARKEEKNTPEANVYVRKFLQRISWRPTLSVVFAGALLYPRYNFFDRTMIRLIMKLTGGETDPTVEIEYTDWNKVAAFAAELAEL